MPEVSPPNVQPVRFDDVICVVVVVVIVSSPKYISTQLIYAVNSRANSFKYGLIISSHLIPLLNCIIIIN